MKKIVYVVLAFYSCTLFAQETQENSKSEKAKQQANEAADRIVVGFSFDNWIYDRDEIDSLNTKWNSWGFQFYYMYDIPLGKSRFSLAPGLGFSASWVKNNSTLDETVDSIGTFFRPFSGYKRNSLVASYFDIPLELRFRGKANASNKSFKLAAGVIGGVQMRNYTKTKGENAAGEVKILKVVRYEDIMRFRFGPTFRIGYGSFNLSFYYSVLSLFKDGEGPDVHPFSAGFTINGL